MNKLPSQKEVWFKRKARMYQYINKKAGTQQSPNLYYTFDYMNFTIGFLKPGRGAALVFDNRTKDDMRPVIKNDSVMLDGAATFGDIIKIFEDIGSKSTAALEAVGTVLFRSSALVDHHLNDDGIVTYIIPEQLLSIIKQDILIIDGFPTRSQKDEIPIEIFLHYLDAISLNEDVNYHSQGFDLSKKNTGGKNNLLTYVNIITIILEKQKVSDFANRLLTSNVWPISQKFAKEVFPDVFTYSEPEV